MVRPFTITFSCSSSAPRIYNEAKVLIITTVALVWCKCQIKLADLLALGCILSRARIFISGALPDLFHFIVQSSDEHT